MKYRYLLLLLPLFLLTIPSRAQSVDDVADRHVELAAPETGSAGKNASATRVRSARVEDPFNGVILQGFSADRESSGEIRFGADGAWGAWQPLYIVRSATDGFFMAAYRSDTFRAGVRFEVRFTYRTGTAFSVDEAGVFDSRNAADALAARLEPGPPPIDPQDFGLVIPPRLIPRSQWGAAPFRGSPVPLARPTYNYITFHHAAGFSATTYEEGLAQVKAIQNLHQNGNGWSDIGYHFIVDKSGRVYQGRPFLDDAVRLEDLPTLALGAHAGGANTGNIGVCLLGCYHPPEGGGCRDVITPAALDSIVTLFAFLSERYHVSPDNIRGHRDFGATACPGDNNYSLLPEIRAQVRELLVTGNQPLGRATLAAATDSAGVVVLSWAFAEVNDIDTYRIERAYLNQTTVVYRGTGALPDRFIDADVSLPGPVVYRLYAENERGREQLLAVTQVEVTVPAQDVLAESFPNPFERTTTIRYYLEQDGVVHLRVYDVTGREVGALVDAFQEGGRWHTARFEAGDLPSGVYFYRLRVEGFAGVTVDEVRTLVRVR